MSFNPPYMMLLARLTDWWNKQTNLAFSAYGTGLFVSDVTTGVSMVTIQDCLWVMSQPGFPCLRHHVELRFLTVWY